MQAVYAFFVATLTLLISGAFWLMRSHPAQAPGTIDICTQEAKVCPDGTAVGRTGPNCSFAACPVHTPTTASTSTSSIATPFLLETKLGKEGTKFDVHITPVEVVQDSRCPVDVQCIQAGTVVLKVHIVDALEDTTQELTLGQPITTKDSRITLKAVSPVPHSGTPISTGMYTFTIEVAKLIPI